MKEVKYLILGAGISGLSFAEKKKKEDYIILEKESIPGGLCQSFKEKGYVWDVSGHFFHFHSEKTKNYYEKLMRNKKQMNVKKCAKVFYNNYYVDAPFQYNIHQLPINEYIECLTDLFYASESQKSISFEEFVREKYGNGIANKFLIPYNEKLYACKMNELEKNSMGGYLPKLDFNLLMSFYKGKQNKTYNDTFDYPINGCGEIIDALIEQIDENNIKYNVNIESIDIHNKIVYTTENKYKYKYLISTIPLTSFNKIIKNNDKEELKYNKILVINIGFDNESIDKNVSWIYFPGKEIFYRVGFYNNIVGEKLLSIYVEISYKVNEEINIDSAIKETLKDLKNANIINNHNVVALKTYIISPGYVHITSKGEKYKNELIKKLEEDNIYMIGRYAKWEYSAMDSSLEQAELLSLKI